MRERGLGQGEADLLLLAERHGKLEHQPYILSGLLPGILGQVSHGHGRVAADQKRVMRTAGKEESVVVVMMVVMGGGDGGGGGGGGGGGACVCARV